MNLTTLCHSDVFKYNLLDYLDLKDIRNIEKIYGLSFQKYYNKIIINCINAKLKDIFKDKLDEFKKQLNKNGAIIAGSFITQSILNEVWDKSDVDIFIPVGFNADKNGYITHSYNFATNFEKYIFEQFKYLNYEACNRYDNVISKTKINWLREYATENKNYTKIQTIQVKVDTEKEMHNFIIYNFDFDICKVIYGIDNNKEYVYIHNLDTILDKNFTFKYTNSVESSLSRYYRYIKRGFKITIPNSKKIHNQLIQKYNVINLKNLNESFGSYSLYEIISDKYKPLDIDNYIFHKEINGKIIIKQRLTKSDLCSVINCPLNFIQKQHYHISTRYFFNTLQPHDTTIIAINN